MKIEINSELISNLKSQGFGAEVTFDAKNVEPFPQECEITNFSIELRQRYVDSGQIDNLVFRLGKEESIAFGVWLLSAAIHKEHKSYSLKLIEPGSKIKKILVHIEEENPEIEVKSFKWKSQNIEDFVQDCEFYLGHKISIRASNESDEWFNQEQYYERDVIRGFGGLGGLCLASEFFMNLGLECSDINYEYLKYEFSKSLANENSCEIRAEIV